MECVGVVDFLDIIRTQSIDAYMSWSERFHPLKYFLGVVLQDLHCHVDKNGSNAHAGRVAVFAGTARVNANWDFKGSKYGQSIGGRKRAMPLNHSEKVIEKWQNSLPNRILVPQWLEGCTTMEDVVRADKLNAIDPCPHCR
jgi:hypothetical protein